MRTIEEIKKEIHELEGVKARLNTKRKGALYQDHFFDAEKFECQMDEVGEEINELKAELKKLEDEKISS